MLDLHADVDPPQLRCVQVDENTGEVTLQWDAPADPGGEFVSYIVEHSTSPTGPFTTVPIPNYATTSYTHNVDASLAPVYYQLKTVFNAGAGADTSAPYLGTISTIFPQFFQNHDSVVVVTWNPIFSGTFPGLAPTYQIYRRIGGAGVPWEFITDKNIGDESLVDSFKICVENVAYKIEIANTIGGCTNVSSVLEELFEDNTPPEIPPVDSVSVDRTTGNLIIGWRRSPSGDTRGYQIIYRDIIADQNIIIDSTIGKLNTSYVDVLASGNTEVRQYGIAAFDTCEKGFPPASNVSSIEGWHRTMFLQAIPNYCENLTTLNWSSYVGWDTIVRYGIYASLNGGAYSRVGEVSGADSSFIHENIDLTNEYCYFIRAFDDNARTSSSNEVCPDAAGSIIAGVHYVYQATVITDKIVSVKALTDSTIDASYYRLQRSLDEYGPFFEVGRIPNSNTSDIELIDSTARANETDYYYYIDILDSCGFILGESNKAKTVHLSAEFDRQLFINQLDWTVYLGWDTSGSGVQAYEIHRFVDTKNDIQLVTTQDPFNRFYEEPMDEWMVEGVNICYQIKAIEDIGNQYGIQSFSESNVVCLSDNALIYVPNAFHPNGFNPIFKPSIAFGDHRSYKLRIFDRGGRILFESNDPDLGWDGTKDGNDCGLGVYVWDLEVTNLAGDVINERGSVLLYR